MCGIIGYMGNKRAMPVLLSGLARLEYRGYDSAGIALLEDGEIKVFKQAGRLAGLQERLSGNGFLSTTGIGHTRWATHGRPADHNAHPHSDCGGRFVVVHNGIIENYLELKNWLISEGHVFKSETDTEVLPHMIEHFYNGDLIPAVSTIIEKIRGSYAMVVLSALEPENLVSVRKDSPLVIGAGDEENFFASDVPAFLHYTRNVHYLDDGEISLITSNRVEVFNEMGQNVSKPVHMINWEAEQAEKGGYDHFMLKEIHEQPTSLKNTLSGRISEDGGRVNLQELSLDLEKIKNIKKIFITACGTAYHAGLVGKYAIESLARIPVEIDIASEFRYRNLVIEPDSLVVIISQSGETADSLAALRDGKKRGMPVIAITNVVGSSIAREADHVLYTWAGPEIAVASTKAYTAQLVSLYLLALYLADVRETIPEEESRQIIGELLSLSGKVQQILDRKEAILDIGLGYEQSKSIFFIGRGLDYAVACEGSLKLKEISYIHAEAYAAGELKHGTLALIEKDIPVVTVVTQPFLFEKTFSNIKEVKAREADVFALAMEGMDEVEKEASQVFYIPETHPLLTPVLSVIPLQLLAYYVSLARGCDVDKPRNLAKSVTVE
jgi:glucosamine--fructose-6-phosphate aminotransferase (isomerizing)